MDDEATQMMDESAPELDEDSYSALEDVKQLLGEYWAATENGDDLWHTLMEKENAFFEAFERRGLLLMARLVFSHYFGLTGNTSQAARWQTQTIAFAGEDGELVEFCVNELRSFYDQIFNMMTKNRPAFQAQAINTDFDSLSTIEAADSMVQYYYEQVLGEKREKEAVKIEGMYGKSYLHVEWDEDGGPDVEMDIEVPGPNGLPLPAKQKVKAGQFIISALYPWNVICEPFRSEHDGHLWRSVVPPNRSKWEMMVRYPLFAKEIYDSSMPESDYKYRFPGSDPLAKEPEDMCAIRIFYHERCGVLPNGRKCVFVNGIMVDSDDLPVDEIPVIPFMSCELHGTSFGISDLWNLIPTEQMQNQVLSDMATNIEAFGRPPIAIQEGTDIDLDALANGQKVLFVPQGMEAPQPIKFPTVPDISFKVLELLRTYKQSLTGLNAIARGETSTNITSGTHAALYSQIAVEAQNPRQMELDLMREKTANLLLQHLKRYAKAPQMVRIIGVDERAYMKEFKKDAWEGVHSVVVKTANPMMRTLAGRLQIVEMLRDWPDQPLKDPKQIVELIVSGQIKPLYSSTRRQELRIKYENEKLANGPEIQETQEADPTTGQLVTKRKVPTVPVFATDNARDHINGHLEELCSPAALENPKIMTAIYAHILDHLDVARNGDPFLAQILQNPTPQEAPMQQQAGANGSGPTPKQVGDVSKEAQQPNQGENDKLGAKLPSPAQAPSQAAS